MARKRRSKTAPVAKAAQATPANDNLLTNPPGNLCTKEEIAEFLRVTTRTIEVWMARGLPHYRLGSRRTRFDRDQVRRYLDEKCAAA